MESTKQNTLYLTIKQVYFDQIVAGTKKEEYREIKDTTYKKYLACDENGYPDFDDEKISEDDPLLGDICVCNNGVYPYYPKDNLKYLRLVVGYAKERDTALVEVTGITLQPMTGKDGNPARFHFNGEDAFLDPDGELCFWIAVFHLGKVVEVKRKE